MNLSASIEYTMIGDKVGFTSTGPDAATLENFLNEVADCWPIGSVEAEKAAVLRCIRKYSR